MADALDTTTAPSSRRGFLRGLATLPLIGGGVTLIGNPTAAAVPCTQMMLNAYTAFLAHEHRRVLVEQFRHTDWTGVTHEHPPMYWFPDYEEVEHLVAAAKPSTRAAVVLAAVGVDWRVRTL